MSQLRSFTYRLPGGVSFTYSGEPKTRLAWFMETWQAGLALWHMWWLFMVELARRGHVPRPAVAGQMVRIYMATPRVAFMLNGMGLIQHVDESGNVKVTQE